MATPASLKIRVSSVSYSRKPLQVSVDLLDKAGGVLDPQPATFMVVPTAAATVSADGQLSCARNADVTVSATAGGLTSLAQVRCVLPARIAIPGEGEGLDNVVFTAVVGDVGIELPEVSAVDDAGAAFPAPVETSIGDRRIADLVDGKLVGLARGWTLLSFSLGDLSESRLVGVWDRTTTPLLLNDGQSEAHTLPPGSYTAEIAVQGNAGGVVASWVGASCPAKSGLKFEAYCDSDAPMTLIVENRAELIGYAANGQISILRGPDDFEE